MTGQQLAAVTGFMTQHGAANVQIDRSVRDPTITVYIAGAYSLCVFNSPGGRFNLKYYKDEMLHRDDIMKPAVIYADGVGLFYQNGLSTILD